MRLVINTDVLVAGLISRATAGLSFSAFWFVVPATICGEYHGVGQQPCLSGSSLTDKRFGLSAPVHRTGNRRAVAVLQDRGHLAQRAARPTPNAFRRILQIAGDDSPIPGRRIAGWPAWPHAVRTYRCCNKSATRSPIIMDGRLVLVRVTRGMIEASAT
jgi:hypothetical protein